MLRSIVIPFLLMTTALSGGPKQVVEKPNIIFILADDLGWADLQCYGDKRFRSPQLARLAKEGMLFTDAYAASPVCSPTRSSIMTGKYPARNNLTLWIGGKGGAPAVQQMALEECTIAEALKEAGYATGMVGKWHLGNQKFFPKEQGFDVAIGPPHAGTPPGGYYLPNKIKLPGAKKGEYLTDRLTDEGLKYIEDNKEGPFFLYQSYHSVHTPIAGRRDLVKKHQDRAKAEGININPHYAAMIESLDTGVGRILDKLDELKIADRTIVIFFSDNGGFSHARGKKNDVTDNAPLRMGKGYLYEGGIREPLLIRFPGLVKPGTVCKQPVVSTDFYPTLLELAGVPAKPEQHADGLSLAPILKDPDSKLDRDAIYFHYPHDSPQGGKPSGAVRAGQWKLVEHFGNGQLELFNLGDDTGETKDLSKEKPQILESLHTKLKEWRKSVDAQMPK